MRQAAAHTTLDTPLYLDAFMVTNMNSNRVSRLFYLIVTNKIDILMMCVYACMYVQNRQES